MARGSGVNPLLRKKSVAVKSSDQNSDITVFAEENFSGNSESFEVSNSQFKTNFDICFKDPVKSIIVSGRLNHYSFNFTSKRYSKMLLPRNY